LNSKLLEALTLLFFAPDTAANVTLRQCLSTFFQAYCYSSPTNQVKFAEVRLRSRLRVTSNSGAHAIDQVILPAFTKLCIIYGELREEGGGEPEMIHPERILGVLLEYADPAHVVYVFC
jgi:condensin complex subunit 3